MIHEWPIYYSAKVSQRLMQWTHSTHAIDSVISRSITDSSSTNLPLKSYDTSFHLPVLINQCPPGRGRSETKRCTQTRAIRKNAISRSLILVKTNGIRREQRTRLPRHVQINVSIYKSINVLPKKGLGKPDIYEHDEMEMKTRGRPLESGLTEAVTTMTTTDMKMMIMTS